MTVVFYLQYRFILVLLYPVLQVLLLAIIDNVRKDSNKVIRIGSQVFEVKEKKWKIGATTWITVARVGLPVLCLLSSLAILVPGIVNSLIVH